jgi:hypothetical protein
MENGRTARQEARALGQELDDLERLTAEQVALWAETASFQKRLEHVHDRVEHLVGGERTERTPLPWRLRRLRRHWGYAAPVLTDTLASAKKHESDRKALDLLRTLRTEVQDVRASVRSLGTGHAPKDAFAKFYARSKGHIDQIVDEVDRLEQKKGHPDDLWRHVKHLWEQIADNAEALIASVGGGGELESVLPCVDLIEAESRELVYWIGWRTIPERINDWLEKTPPGGYLSFHEIFEDELPDRKDRETLLRFLSYAPSRVRGGFVDTETGLIFRYHQQRSKRIGSAAIVAGVLVAVTAAVIAFQLVFARDRLIAWWAALAAGSLFGAAVEQLKRARLLGTGALAGGFILGRVTYWLDAHVTAMVFKVIAMAVGFVGAVLVLGDSLERGTDVLTMFLVGYGLDSFVGIFTSTLDQRASALAAQLKAASR